MSGLTPYAALGLRHNPFLADPVPGVAEPFWIVRDVPPPPEPGQRRILQLLGEKGAGKTSLSLHWRRERPGPYRYVPPTLPLLDGWRRFAPLPVAPLVYWDEADRVPAALLWWGLRRAAKSGATVVVGTHRDLTPEATRAGLPLRSHEFPPLTPEALRAWCAPRIAAAALPGTAPADRLTVPAEVLRQTCEAAGSSLREASVILHVWAARAARSAAALASDSPSPSCPTSPPSPLKNSSPSSPAGAAASARRSPTPSLPAVAGSSSAAAPRVS
ncbi:hypothetical protein [Alienimonas californiensis]|uniref:hypothetical protein n=1 Tax=Alienimonas californiensis TaxID=2527989 RepID=UPI001F60BDD6|nr:hypothetical protein [Alienimonas californiensis]